MKSDQLYWQVFIVLTLALSAHNGPINSSANDLRPADRTSLLSGGWLPDSPGNSAPGFHGHPARKDQNLPFPSLLPDASFRIIFGLKDIEPKAWDGHVMADGDQSIQLEADRFRNHQYDKTVWTPEGHKRIKVGDPAFPNDYLRSDTSWVCSTRESPLHGPTTEWHVHSHQEKSSKINLQQPSILVHLRSNSLDQPIQIKTVGGGFNFLPRDIIRQHAGYFLKGSIKVEFVPSERPIAEEYNGQQDFPSVLSSKSGRLWIAWQEYDGDSDLVLSRSILDGDMSPISVLAEKGDVFHTALGEDADNRIWAIWSMQVDGRWDLYGRFFDRTAWSNQVQLTNGPATKNFFHQVVTDSEGRMWLIWQRTANGFSQIYAKNFNGRQWSDEELVSQYNSASGNNWCPSVATGTDGSLVVAWDGYASGSYDVYLRRWKDNVWEDVKVVAGTGRFESHPSVAVDNRNRIWIAWDESGSNWGKDKGFLVQDRKATQLHESRSIRIACFDGTKWLQPQEDLNQVLDTGEFWELPHLQIDSDGNPLLFVRHLVMREPDTPLEGPIDLALWEIHLTQYTGSHWTEPVCLPHSTGRNDMIPTSTVDKEGRVWAVWATDLRDARSFLPQQLQVRFSKFGSRDSKADLALKSFTISQSDSVTPFDSEETEQVKRIRAYKIRTAGKTYSIYRGDLHRHTDNSEDGYTDGSLLDAYRYALDVAALDFLGVADHTGDIWDPYNWWRNEKAADLFQNQNTFVAFYGYERSVEYPNGHRNIFFPKRGTANILPISPFEANGSEGSGRLYWYLHRNNGFSIPHTTGRTSGTDWRDHDPKVESLVEIYQGMRDSYEYPGSPRPYALYALPDTTKAVPRASSAEHSPSFRPLGFVWNALAKGYKLGFIASSDHISTHISYACLISEELTPKSLLEAVRQRRAYAATDNIILDLQYASSNGVHLMGEKFESLTPLHIKAKIIGTGEIQQIDIIKNNSIAHTFYPNQAEYTFEYLDSDVKNGESYYYVRIIQKDGEMAWGSPVWVTYE